MTETIELSADLDRRLTDLAKRIGMNRNEFLFRVIEDGILDAEADLRADAVEARIASGEEKTMTSTDVRRALGLEH
ncbi:CopG family transcriptional regulator [Rhizobium sp. FKY42]|uniref:CopG family transcriptional regulator n=1 Tax=Rhizobium sp. FKY42 TaxID=2562310 RepID=UPI0010BFB064|nr:CopG family transcriptional regulator [Rhizobium sp. FKY42]